MGRPRHANPLGLPVRVYLHNGRFRYRDRAGTWHTLGKSWDRAAKLRYAEASTDTASPGTVTDLIDRYLTKYGPTKALSTREGHVAEAKNLKGFFGRMAPRDVTPPHIAQYRDARCDKRGHSAPVRANRELSLFSSVLAYGLELGLVDRNPCLGVRRNKERPRTREVDDDEYAAFMAFAIARGKTNELLARTAHLAYLTGQRRQDILTLTQADLRDDGIHFVQRKTGAMVVIEWTPSLREAVRSLLAVRSDAAARYLIATGDGQHYSDSGFKTLWNRLLVAWATAGHERFRFHDLRARSVGTLKRAGRMAKDVTGHRTEATADRIYDRRTAKRAKAVE